MKFEEDWMHRTVMTRHRQLSLLATALVVVVGSLVIDLGTAQGESARTIGPTPPRLAFIEGEVSFWRPGADDWTPARINMPLAAGDSLYTGDGAHLELAVGRRAFVRTAPATKLDIASLETGYLQLELASGHAALDLKDLPEGQRVEVDTPQGAVTIDRAGYYRIDVDEHTVVTTHRGGPATVIPIGGGSATDVAVEQQVILEGTEVASASTHSAPGGDAFDRWNRNRTTQLASGPRHRRYVSSDVAGVDDLDRAGTWRETRRYGRVWVPTGVAADWAPYTTGQWVWDAYYGWTWVDDAPWGWAPYHYGRWVGFDGWWGWAPGPIVVAPIYAPALVAFFGPVGVSVNVGIGFPFISWVALGWGEPVFPWWGPVGFIGRPFWCGWGGPRFVNNVFINNRTIVSARNVSTFRNLGVRNAVSAVSRNQFGRGAVQSAHLTSAQTRGLQPIRGQLGVRPTARSLVAASGHAQRPPEWMQHRQVAATRSAQDPARSLRSAGLASATTKTAPLRLVQSTRRSGASVAHARTTASPARTTRGSPAVASRSAAHPTVRGSTHAPASRSLASGAGHRPTAGRGFASTPPAHGSARPQSSGRSFASRPSHPSRPTFARPSVSRPNRSFQPRASFRPSRPSSQPRASFGAPHAAMSGRRAGPAPRRSGRG